VDYVTKNHIAYAFVKITKLSVNVSFQVIGYRTASMKKKGIKCHMNPQNGAIVRFLTR